MKVLATFYALLSLFIFVPLLEANFTDLQIGFIFRLLSLLFRESFVKSLQNLPVNLGENILRNFCLVFDVILKVLVLEYFLYDEEDMFAGLSGGSISEACAADPIGGKLDSSIRRFVVNDIKYYGVIDSQNILQVQSLLESLLQNQQLSNRLHFDVLIILKLYHVDVYVVQVFSWLFVILAESLFLHSILFSISLLSGLSFFYLSLYPIFLVLCLFHGLSLPLLLF